jgi:hypothetical protein
VPEPPAKMMPLRWNDEFFIRSLMCVQLIFKCRVR